MTLVRLGGAQIATSTITISANVRLLLGRITLVSSATPVLRVSGNGASILGMSPDDINGSIIKNTGVGDTIQVGSDTETVRNLSFHNFALDGSDTAAKGIISNNAGDWVIEQIRIVNHLDDAIRIAAGIHIELRNNRIVASRSRLNTAVGGLIGTDPNRTTVRSVDNDIQGYPTLLRNNGSNTVGFGNIYELASGDAIISTGNGFASIGDYF